MHLVCYIVNSLVFKFYHCYIFAESTGKMADRLEVHSPNVTYTPAHISSRYTYSTTQVSCEAGKIIATPKETVYTFRTERKVPRVGCMLVGWGGNNGSTVTAAVIANKLGLSWHTKEGVQQSNYFGSITQSSTVNLGAGPDGDVFIPFKDLLPMVQPEEIVFGGE